MVQDNSSHFPGVYHVRNRVFIIILSSATIIWALLELFQVFTPPSPFLLAFIWLALWLYVLFNALRRRLVISEDGLEYTGDFSRLRVKWSEVKYIESRRQFLYLFWTTEGLVIRTDLPDAKEHFVDLQQFSRNWRHEPLGQVLMMKAPHLFPSHISR